MQPIRVLIACEESQAVCKAFRERGHEAYSCDVQECSGGHPEWHIHGDCLPIINGHCTFTVQNGDIHTIDSEWDLLIAHPPCTYLTVSGNAYFNIEKYGDKARERYRLREEAADFFMSFINANCQRIAVENPIGYMNTHYRKPDQIVQPYWFGHPFTKSTCLWLKNLPKLTPTDLLEKPESGWKNQLFDANGHYGGYGGSWGKNPNGTWRRYGDPEVAKERSKTFPGFAEAMAAQWGAGDEN